MILALRQRHRGFFVVLSILLPIAFIGGIAARRPVPAVAVLPLDLRGPAQNFTITSWTRSGFFAKALVTIRLLRERGDARFAVGFSAAKDFLKPDLIVYWTAGNPKVDDTLPDNALLLGAFSSAALPLPDEAAKTSGVFILYSLADNEIVDVSQPVQLGNSRR